MKLGAVTTAWRDEETIRGTLACLHPHVEKHIVLISEKPFYGNDLPPDKTEEICREFEKVIVLKGVWEEHTMRNLGVRMCNDCDWVIGFDADEMMTGDDLAKLKVHLGRTNYDAVGFISKVYWRTPDYIFSPDPDHVKVCVIRQKSSATYIDKQCVNCAYEILDYKDYPYITHHHLSWSDPKNIHRKVIHYNHANEFDGEKWYNEHYVNWQPGKPVYQPFGTKWEALRSPLPKELRRLL